MAHGMAQQTGDAGARVRACVGVGVCARGGGRARSGARTRLRHAQQQPQQTLAQRGTPVYQGVPSGHFMANEPSAEVCHLRACSVHLTCAAHSVGLRAACVQWRARRSCAWGRRAASPARSHRAKATPRHVRSTSVRCAHSIAGMVGGARRATSDWGGGGGGGWGAPTHTLVQGVTGGRYEQSHVDTWPVRCGNTTPHAPPTRRRRSNE
jgi:hypothetical protein